MKTSMGRSEPFGCHLHARTDCGCPGYPTFPDILRDCGSPSLCRHRPRDYRCLRCQAADIIVRLENRNAAYLERILELQDTIEELTPPVGHITIHLPTTTVENIVQTDRIFPALEELRTAINTTWGNR